MTGKQKLIFVKNGVSKTIDVSIEIMNKILYNLEWNKHFKCKNLLLSDIGLLFVNDINRW